MKKIVLKLNIYDEKSKQKAMKAASTLRGINSIAVDLKDKKMTVIGEVDPVEVIEKMRKSWRAEIILVGPANEPEKKDDPKKNETSGGSKKPDGSGGGGGGQKKKDQNEQIAELVNAYKEYNACMKGHHYVQYVEQKENPNFCVIC